MSGRSMLKWAASAVTVLALGGLAACGEKPQEGAKAAKKADNQAWSGANPAFMAEGWKAGDRESWEQQLKARNQQQNEYNRSR
jgi:hypothetical protein